MISYVYTKNNQSKKLEIPDDLVLTYFYTGLMALSRKRFRSHVFEKKKKKKKTILDVWTGWIYVKCMLNYFLKVINQKYLILSKIKNKK